MSQTAADSSHLKLGEKPIQCTYHYGNHDPKPGIFHQFVDAVDTDEGNNKFAVTYALVEDLDGGLHQVEPQFVKIKR
ncbi:hypothetical protein [Stenotrophomonas maltophilia]|uniref:hypothetical protein n=1 Tax=Stenotrophomonas maltophilia TaxID=40324 RepID=UPI001FA7F18A|nr:hypothetical protein [Stenotrophomonas maltophilia]MCU1041293.1 hypothetical protein [Stenotrophomonas maltophilia]